MLTQVTVTGADDAVYPADLVALSREFPFVEWGILMSVSRAGTPRYPSRKWMIGLENVAKQITRHSDKPLQLSAHFCGEVARHALLNKLHDFPVIERVQRIQINGYVPVLNDIVAFAKAMPCYQIILQVRAEAELQTAAIEATSGAMNLLFDPSGGRGIEPFKWPRAPCGDRMGYAGGITPDNVKDVVRRIYEDTGFTTGDFWIDLESGARDENDRFDLARVRKLLENVSPLIKSGCTVPTECAESTSGDLGVRCPVQRQAPYVKPDGVARSGKPAGTVSLTEAAEAYSVYAKRYGTSQSFERLHERGGFGYWELSELLGHEPKTWLSS